MTRTLLVGDPHYRTNMKLLMDQFSEEIIRLVQEQEIELVVFLGDQMDRHEVIPQIPFYQCVDLVCRLLQMEIEVVLIIGNHDFRTHTAYLPREHPFISWTLLEERTGRKAHPLLEIVHRPRVITFRDFTALCLPFVPPGSFQMAVDEALADESDKTLNEIDVIFCHQEFKEAQMGHITSEAGDVVPVGYPPIISGHIHDRQVLQRHSDTNFVIYMGTGYMAFAHESPNKTVSIVELARKEIRLGENDLLATEQRVRLDMPLHRIVRIPAETAEQWLEDQKRQRATTTVETIIKPHHLKDEIVLEVSGSDAEVSKLQKSNFQGRASAGLKHVRIVVQYKHVFNNQLFPKMMKQLNHFVEGLSRSGDKRLTLDMIIRSHFPHEDILREVMTDG